MSLANDPPVTRAGSLTSTLLPALLWAIACFAEAHAAPSVQFYDGTFECYAGPLALRLPGTYAQLLRLGELRSTRAVRSQTQRGLTTTERQIEFPGLIMRVYLFSGDPGRYQLASVRIDSPAWQLSPLRVGQLTNAVALEPGWPRLPSQGRWEIQGDSSRLIVSITAGRVAAIDYVCDSGR